jgi:hypothetical protein
MDLGHAQQCKRMAEAAVEALGLNFENTSPSDIRDAIARLRNKITVGFEGIEQWRCLRCDKKYDKPTYEEGFHPDGRPAGVYYCPRCR